MTIKEKYYDNQEDRNEDDKNEGLVIIKGGKFLFG